GAGIFLAPRPCLLHFISYNFNGLALDTTGSHDRCERDGVAPLRRLRRWPQGPVASRVKEGGRMSVAVSTPILRLATGPLAGKVFEVESTLRVGRHPFNEVSLSDPGLSRYHCWIMI